MKLICFLVLLGLQLTHGKNIKVAVKAWKETSLFAEASEFFNAQDPVLFWPFVETVSSAVLESCSHPVSQQDLYRHVVAYSEKNHPRHATNSLKYALSLRYYSPLVELHYQFTRKYLEDFPAVGTSDCFAIIPGAVGPLLTVKSLSDYLSSEQCLNATNTQPQAELFEFDHIHQAEGIPAPGQCNATVILHCNIGSKSFQEFSTFFTAQSGLTYVLRHHLPKHFTPEFSNKYPSLGEPAANPEQEWQAKMTLQGYGVELQIKNMEYKNIDEKIPATGDLAADGGDAASAEEGDDGEAVVDTGFDFSVLLQRRPELAEQLTEFREHLQQELDSLRTGDSDTEDIKVWQLQALGFQACAKILQASSPLDVLKDISQNFPKRAGAVSKVSVASKKYDAMVKAILKNQMELRTHEGTSRLYINGREQTIETLTPFGLFTVVTSDGQLVSNLNDLVKPVTPPGADVANVVQDLLQTPMSNTGPVRINPYTGQRMQSGLESRFHFKAGMVQWMNDIEKDPRYRGWPSSLNELLKPSYFGQVRYSRRNLYNAIYIIDPSQKAQLMTIPIMQRFLAQDAPTRVGIVPICPETIRLVKRLRTEDDVDVLASDKSLEKAIAKDMPPPQKSVQVSVTAEGATEVVEEGSKEEDTPNSYQHLPTLANKIIALFDHLVKKDRDVGFNFLSQLARDAKGETITDADVEATWKATAPSHVQRKDNIEDIIVSRAAKASIQKTAMYVVDRGFTSTPLCLFNGLLIQNSQPRESFYTGMQQEQPHVRELIRDGVLKEKMKDVYKGMLEHANAQTRYNPQVFGTSQFQPIRPGHSILHTLQYIYPRGHTDTIPDITHLLVTDLGTLSGLAAAVQALNHFVAASSTASRLALIHRSAVPVVAAFEALAAATADRTEQASTLLQFVVLVRKTLLMHKAKALQNSDLEKILQAMDAAQGGEAEQDTGNAYAQKGKLPVAFNLKAALKFFNNGEGPSNFLSTMAAHVQFARTFTTVPTLITNGRVLQLTGESALLTEDYAILEAYERLHRTQALLKTLAKYDITAKPDTTPEQSRTLADTVSLLVGHLANDWFKNGERVDDLPTISANESTPSYGFAVSAKEKLKGPGEPIILNVVAIIDPLSSAAQKLSTFLASLHESFHAHISVHLNPVTQVSALPLKSFYRYVLVPDIQFDAETGSIVPPTAYFTNVAESKILTMGVEEPEAWIIMSHYAPADLDNIKLEDFEGKTLYAEYQLEHLMVTGSCIDVSQNNPPRGLELVMTNDVSAADVQDTLVMSNFGYFQLKGNPGIWRLGLKPKSRGDRIFEIAGQFTLDSNPQDRTMRPRAVTNVVVRSFSGEYFYLKVNRREGMENEELLAEDPPEPTLEPDKEEEEEEGIWQRLGSLLGKEKEKVPKKAVARRPGEATLNIFSLASGHLYERLLKVMIHTVTNYTSTRPDSHVKFWFVKNFLSPQFKRFLPYMAKEWGFSFELVTYKWPKWLRRQTEKQRIIWAYKILFLDVLFPLSLDKVIFVDADQIVRTDLHELYNKDLRGKPLAYTPFCDSRKETEGFRFWKQGYWRDHLRGAPYHISALYVVDIKKFRQMAAGDNFRMIYDDLTNDPNSLANLDQDLPNYAQYVIGIHSLEQEWLWCETWCSDESKVKAKTIDLCNNPLTKVPKLENARRIIPEWDDYDAHIRQFEKKLNLPQY